MITIDQAVASSISAPRPILLLDTCTLLDIVRAPLRDLTAAVRAGVELRAPAACGAIRLLVQDIVPGEWADNLPAARRDGEAGVRAFTATWQNAFAGLCGARDGPHPTAGRIQKTRKSSHP